MTKKHILIVTGSDYSERVYEGLKTICNEGHTLYLLSDGSFEPKPGIFTKHFTFDLRKTKETLDYMRGQPERFDAVTIKTSEWLTPLVALLAKYYGCIGNKPRVAFNCRSKYHMRRQLDKYQIPIPHFQLARDLDELKTAIKTIGLPCVAKPVGGNASYGTFLLKTKADLEAIDRSYQSSIDFLKQKAISEDIIEFSKEELTLLDVPDDINMVTDYLIEKYMEGPEISVDALVQNGQITITGIEFQERMAPPFFVQLGAEVPFRCTEPEMKAIKHLIQRTVTAMEITNSATHTEIIFTKDGMKIVEIGCRIGGDNLHDSIYEITGINMMEESIRIALGENRTYEVLTQCHTKMKYLLPEKKGTLQNITIPDTVENDPDIFELIITAKQGDTVAPPPESFDFLGYLSAKGKTPEEASTNLQKALDNISVTIKE